MSSSESDDVFEPESPSPVKKKQPKAKPTKAAGDAAAPKKKVPAAAKKAPTAAKKAPAKKKKAAYLDESDASAYGGTDAEREEDDAAVESPTKQSIEQIYQKKTQLEHILLRPDTYGTSYVLRRSIYGCECVMRKSRMSWGELTGVWWWGFATVGSIEPVTQSMWVFDDETKKMEQRKITYVRTSLQCHVCLSTYGCYCKHSN